MGQVSGLVWKVSRRSYGAGSVRLGLLLVLILSECLRVGALPLMAMGVVRL